MSYTLEGAQIKPINELIDLQILPPELTLGIPEEISRKHFDDSFIYAQFAKLSMGESAFCVSTAAGNDISGRQVFLTNLQILSEGEKPSFPPPPPQKIESTELPWLEKLLSGDQILFEPVHRMLKEVALNPHIKSFASHALLSTKYKPDWMPKKKASAINKYSLAWLVVFFLAVFAIIIIKQR